MAMLLINDIIYKGFRGAEFFGPGPLGRRREFESGVSEVI